MPTPPRRTRAGRSPLPLVRALARATCTIAPGLAVPALAALFLLAGTHGHLEAQETPAPAASAPLLRGSIAGSVLDTAGSPIAGAQLQVIGLLGRGSTGSDGAFILAGIPTGQRMLRVRRLGFQPESVSVEVSPGAETKVEVRLTALPLRMDAVVVEARLRPMYSGRLARFWERRDRGIGTFFTAEEIDRRNPMVVTDLLRTVPGIRLERNGNEHVVFFRGMRCAPLVWIDGMPATAGYLNPDHFTPNSLAGIEVYAGPSQVPAELMWVRGKGACGVIALWTRLDDPPGKQKKPKVTATDLANLVQSLRLYTADQVDVPAMPDSANPVAPVYPDSLLRSGIAGRVLVEFVVDTTGRADMDTFGVVVSTDRLFSDAVRRAVADASFTPAMVADRPVRQLMQMPFRFIASMPATGRR
ncbi:MAG TPA: TonB family protein [Gemmatimonadales bacterium]